MTRSDEGCRSIAPSIPSPSAEFAALHGILKTNEFQDGRLARVTGRPRARKELARSIRDFWMKNRAIPLAERWYRTLRDDSAGLDRWLEAAAEIVQPSENAGAARLDAALDRAQAGAAADEGRRAAIPARSERLRFVGPPRLRDRPHPGDRLASPTSRLSAPASSRCAHRWDRKAALPVHPGDDDPVPARSIELRSRAKAISRTTLVEFVPLFTAHPCRGPASREALDEYAAGSARAARRSDNTRA